MNPDEIGKALAGGFGGQQFYQQQMQPYVDPALQKIQQLYQMLFGAQKDPNADMMWNPQTGAPEHAASPLRRQMLSKMPQK